MERVHLENPGLNGRIILKFILNKHDGGMEWIDLAGSCECGNKPSGSIKRGDFLDLLTHCQLLKNDSIPCMEVVHNLTTPKKHRRTSG